MYNTTFKITHYITIKMSIIIGRNVGVWIVPCDIDQFYGLKSISIMDNYITIIPKELCNLRTLTDISFHNNKITIIPKEIYLLTNLVSLYLGYNNIRYIPNEMKFLTKLKNFYIFENNLAEFPEIVLSISSLTYVGCTSQKIDSIPIDKVKKMPNIKSFNGMLF